MYIWKYITPAVSMKSQHVLHITFLLYNPFVLGLEKCCPGLGCFDLGPPWATPLRIVPPPRCKEEAPVYFYLFTRANRMSKYSIQTWPKISLKGSNFDGLRNTVFYFHGWQSEPLTSRSTRSLDIKNAFLKLMDANVILVDYTSSSSSTYYPQSVSDIRVVAAQVARLARYLIDTWGASASRMHMIGLSLGAQAAAYSARGVSGVARLTGLDPAGPLFENQDKKVRINEGDAILVEVLHTNGLILGSLGMSRPAGNLDFYFNGGVLQPGCGMGTGFDRNIEKLQTQNVSFTRDIAQTVGCSHVRSLSYYIEAINNPNCIFWGKRRLSSDQPSPTDGRKRSLHDCSLNSCAPVGPKAMEYPARGSFDVITNRAPQFCIKNREVDEYMEQQLKEYLG